MTVGERIKEIRTKLGMSQVDFADKINVSKQTLYKYENNIITKKLISVPDIYLYSVRTEDSIPHYAVSVTAEVEITSKRQDGSRETFSGQYKAVVEFRGSSEADLAAVSGAFVDEKPDYPQETSDSGTTENQ